MRVLLKLNGWRKEEEIPDYLATRGRAFVRLHPPMDILKRGSGDTKSQRVADVEFVRTGERSGDMPVFRTV